MKSAINWLKGFFEEQNGKPSIKRLWGSVLVVIFAITYLKVAIPTQQVLDIPDVWAMLLGGLILGLGAIDKIKGKQ